MDGEIEEKTGETGGGGGFELEEVEDENWRRRWIRTGGGGRLELEKKEKYWRRRIRTGGGGGLELEEVEY